MSTETKHPTNQLNPSLSPFSTPNDFINFFANKFKTLYKDSERIQDLLDKCQESTIRQLDLEDNLRLRHQNTFSLQDSLNQAQLSIYEERENYSKLVAHNEQLKLENEDFRRKFQTVLLLTGTSEKHVTHFLQRHPKANKITDEMIKIRSEIRINLGEKTSDYEMIDPIIILKQVKVLENLIKKTTRLHQDNILSMKECMKLSKTEHSIQIQHLEERLASISQRLKEKNAILHRSLVENLHLQKKIIINENEWMEERKHLIQFGGISVTTSIVPSAVPLGIVQKDSTREHDAIVKRLQRNYSRVEIQLMDKENLLTEYKIQALGLEKQMHRLREENDEYKKTYEAQIKKLQERNKVVQKRLDETEMRRKLDGVGFRADVKSIKNFLNTMDRQLHDLIRRGILGNAVLDSNDVRNAIRPEQKPRRKTVRVPVKPLSKRLQTVPNLAPMRNISNNQHIHNHFRYIRNRWNQFLTINPVSIRSVKDFKESSHLSNVALTKLLEVAQEKVRYLEEVVKRSSAHVKPTIVISK